MTDPIADFLTRLRNASMVDKKFVYAPFSNIKMKIAGILREEGYIEDVGKEDKRIVVKLKYDNMGKPKITGIRRLSKPGQRIYKGAAELPKVLGGYGMAIVSTSKGLKTNKEARKSGEGGELICEIW